MSTTEFFPLWPLFLSAKERSSRERGGAWFLFHVQSNFHSAERERNLSLEINCNRLLVMEIRTLLIAILFA